MSVPEVQVMSFYLNLGSLDLEMSLADAKTLSPFRAPKHLSSVFSESECS